MLANFDQSLRFTLAYEGGWSDHPRDPGGATMKGVTLATFQRYVGRKATKAELRAISDATLKSIYRGDYWNAVKGDTLPAGVDLSMFDYAVNSGPKRALDHDAPGRGLEPRARIKALCARRLKFLNGLKTFDVFGAGWTRRVNACEAKALKLAGARRIELKAEAESSAQKAQIQRTAATANGAAGATASTGAAATGWPTWVIVLVAVAAAASVAYLLFRAWQQAQRADEMEGAAYEP